MHRHAGDGRNNVDWINELALRDLRILARSEAAQDCQAAAQARDPDASRLLRSLASSTFGFARHGDKRNSPSVAKGLARYTLSRATRTLPTSRQNWQRL